MHAKTPLNLDLPQIRRYGRRVRGAFLLLI